MVLSQGWYVICCLAQNNNMSTKVCRVSTCNFCTVFCWHVTCAYVFQICIMYIYIYIYIHTSSIYEYLSIKTCCYIWHVYIYRATYICHLYLQAACFCYYDWFLLITSRFFITLAEHVFACVQCIVYRICGAIWSGKILVLWETQIFNRKPRLFGDNGCKTESRHQTLHFFQGVEAQGV